MPSKDEITKSAVKDLIIGFGFLEGLWINAKVNPFEKILNSLTQLLKGTQFEWYNTFLWMVLFIIVPTIQIIMTYRWGGMLGLLSLVMAFIGGIFIKDIIGVLLVFSAVILGYYSFASDKKITIDECIEFISDVIGYFKK